MPDIAALAGGAWALGKAMISPLTRFLSRPRDNQDREDTAERSDVRRDIHSLYELLVDIEALAILVARAPYDARDKRDEKAEQILAAVTRVGPKVHTNFFGTPSYPDLFSKVTLFKATATADELLTANDTSARKAAAEAVARERQELWDRVMTAAVTEHDIRIGSATRTSYRR